MQLLRLRRTPLRLLLVCALTSGLVGGWALLGSKATSDAATKYTTFVGGGRTGISVETFRPNVVFVNVGDSVEFTNPYEEIHTVTFTAGKPAPDFIVPVFGSTPGPPTVTVNPTVANPSPATGAASYDGTSYVNSGVLNKGQSFVVSFPKEGNYPFLCVIHPGMTGFVQVIRPGVTVPTQAQRDAEAQTQLDQGVAAGDKAAAAIQPTKTTNANGTSTFTVRNAPSAGQSDVMRFIPTRIQANVGDTVTWNNSTLVPHTVTFLSGTTEPDLITPQFQGSGPPTLVFNPQVLFPAGGPNYSGTGFVNSGLMGAGPEATAGTSFSLTFTKAGTYPYICLLHDDQGMAGVIEVGTGISPPSTGDAGLALSGTPHALWLGMALLGSVAALTAAFIVRIRAGLG